MLQVKENKLLQSLLGSPFEVANRLNHPFETDVEILDVEFKTGEKLALTVDVIAEEIEYGLYSDPFLIGWMSVIISLSDLAASGAVPLGLLSILNIERDLPNDFIAAISQGQQAASQKAGVPILGGDTNFTSQTQVGSVGIGKVDEHTMLSRVGMKKGDVLFSSGPLGMGNGFAFQKLFASQAAELPYSPQPRLNEASILKKYATASIDTSDGFFPALGQFMTLNPIGLQIDGLWERLLPAELLAFNKKALLPAWFYLAGPHGEFEILFTIPKAHVNLFLKEAGQINWHPLQIGAITPEEDICRYRKKTFPIEQIINAFYDSDQDPKQYFNQLQKLLKKEAL
jgi:thiamine-monophosphate kinase